MVQELAYEHYSIPSFVVSMAIKLINSNIVDKIHVDLFERLRPSKSAKVCSAPALFLAAAQDGLVKPDKTRELFEKYGSKAPLSEMVLKHYSLCEGAHNDSRDPFTIESCMKFISNEFFSRACSSAELDRRLNDMTRYRRVKRTIHNHRQKRVKRAKPVQSEAIQAKVQSGDSGRIDTPQGASLANQGSGISCLCTQNGSQLKSEDRYSSKPAESILLSRPPKLAVESPSEGNYRSNQQHRRNQSNCNFTGLLNHPLFKTVDDTSADTQHPGLPSRVLPAKKLNMTRKGSLSNLGALEVQAEAAKPKVLMESKKINQNALVSDHISNVGSFRRNNTSQSNRVEHQSKVLFDSMKPEPSKYQRNDRTAELLMSKPTKSTHHQKENSRLPISSKFPNQDYSLISDIQLIDQFLGRK